MKLAEFEQKLAKQLKDKYPQLKPQPGNGWDGVYGLGFTINIRKRKLASVDIFKKTKAVYPFYLLITPRFNDSVGFKNLYGFRVTNMASAIQKKWEEAYKKNWHKPIIIALDGTYKLKKVSNAIDEVVKIIPKIWNDFKNGQSSININSEIDKAIEYHVGTILHYGTDQAYQYMDYDSLWDDFVKTKTEVQMDAIVYNGVKKYKQFILNELVNEAASYAQMDDDELDDNERQRINSSTKLTATQLKTEIQQILSGILYWGTDHYYEHADQNYKLFKTTQSLSPTQAITLVKHIAQANLDEYIKEIAGEISTESDDN